MRIAINGFGRIGRAIVRAAWGQPGFDIVHINDLAPPEMLAYLLRRDSVHGTWAVPTKSVEGAIVIDGVRVGVSAEKDPANLPWADLEVDVVLECTGAFTTREACAAHLVAGAKRVILSAPAKGAVDATFVVGVNERTFDATKHFVVSNASCTTNCLAPLAMVLHRAMGIEHGTMTTVHAYTLDQSMLDAPHRKGKIDRARAGGLNIIPTSTGAAKAIGLVLPELEGRLQGLAVRVPVPDGSLIDLTVETSRATTVEEVNAVLRAAADGPLKGLLAVSDEPLVSTDIVGDPHSCIVDLPNTIVVKDRLVKVLAWYDNEWGFANRMIDLARTVGGQP